MTPTDLFKDVIDQDSAIAQLQKACQNPLHAYLFLGPKGSCKWNAAKAFASLIMTNENQKQNHERSTYLIGKGDHPDLIKIEPTGNQYRDDDVQEIINEASRSPIEGKKKIIRLIFTLGWRNCTLVLYIYTALNIFCSIYIYYTTSFRILPLTYEFIPSE